jgi:hypothetical protein
MPISLAFDNFSIDKDSVRTVDDNGFLHVAVSPVTKEQVAPYYGHEIPNHEELGFESDVIYHGYRPASELSKPDTIQSLNGIPIQFEHHADYANAPAKDTRIGSTGDDAKWESPYLTNSLHFHDAKAIDRIKDGSMRELSLAYRYTPVKKEGEFEGQHYDFVMTDINCNHVALVEEGRAGHDVLVEDAQIKEKNTMADNAAIENAEKNLAQSILDLHKAKEGNVVDKDDTPATDGKLEALIEAIKANGDEDKYKDILNSAEDDDLDASEPAEDDDLDTSGDDSKKDDSVDATDDDLDDSDSAEDEEPNDNIQTENDDDKVIGDALKQCGLDDASPELKKAFITGFKLSSEKDKNADKPLGQDAQIKVAVKAVNRQLKLKYAAANECRQILGNVNAMAFDSAGQIYRAAAKKLGIRNYNQLTGKAAKAVISALTATKDKRTVMATDSAPTAKNSAISEILTNVQVGV